MANTPASRKQKSRIGQQLIRDAILETFPDLQPADVVSCPASSNGCDIWLSPAAQEVFPYAVESKNSEKINIWAALQQAEDNATDGTDPLLIIKRNRSKQYAVIPLELFMKLVGPNDEQN